MLSFDESHINKGKHQNFKKKHFLIHLKTFSKTQYLWEFQRLGEMFPKPKSLINKGKHQNYKKKHFLIRLETSPVTLYL